MLPPEVHGALSQLLEGLQSADNVARSSAEDELNTAWVQSRPDVLLMGLVEQIHGGSEASVCILSTVSSSYGRTLLMK